MSQPFRDLCTEGVILQYLLCTMVLFPVCGVLEAKVQIQSLTEA